MQSLIESNGAELNLVVLFAAGYTPEEFDQACIAVKRQLTAEVTIGCNCQTVLGGEFELEGEQAVSIFAASLPSATLTPMKLEFQTEHGESGFAGWPKSLEPEWPEDSVLLCFADPFSFPMELLLERMNEDRPGANVTGAMSSGGSRPGDCRLLLNDNTFDTGMVGVRISNAKLRTVVSQGCRPIGEPMVITQAERNVIQGLGGKHALDVLYELFQTLPTREQAMLQNGVHVGRVMNEYQDSFGYGDFLIRNVINIDKTERSITIGDYVKPGQTVQFHLRDHETAAEDLNQLVTSAIKDQSYGGCLLFSCNGRGLNLFEEPNHDAATVFNKACHSVAGFFAAGEIGPVCGKNYMHGFAASLLLFPNS